MREASFDHESDHAGDMNGQVWVKHDLSLIRDHLLVRNGGEHLDSLQTPTCYTDEKQMVYSNPFAFLFGEWHYQ